jgi:8-oxo-dGTP pyrophosphatase MutT (NUDIX family)
MESGSLNAVGVWFYSLATQRYLYLMRNDVKHPGAWGLPGGKAKAGESLLDAIHRECCEEMGSLPEYIRMVPLEQFTSPAGDFVYHTFFCCVAEEFRPTLNYEHLGYAWINSLVWPKPMHPGLWNTVNFDAVQNKIQTITKAIHTSQ